MNTKHILLLVVINFLWQSGLCQQLEGLPFVTYYTTQEYDGGIQNWAITQSDDGLIYVANNFGLLEFDGTNWTRHNLPRETKIRDVLVHESGRVYVACQGDFGYLEVNKFGMFEFISLLNKLPEANQDVDEIWRIFEDNGDFYFCTFNEVFIYRKNGQVQVVDPDYAPENFFFVNHSLYVSQLGRGLSKLKDNTLGLVEHGDFFKDKTIVGVLPLANNQLWIATRNQGIYSFNGSRFEPWKTIDLLSFTEASINNVLRLQNGTIAIGTQNRGVYLTTVNGRLIQHLNKGRGLYNRTILSMYEDQLGNLWLGHNNGIAKVELNLPFSIIGEQIGLPGTGYDGFLKDNQLYLGTSNGLYVNSSPSSISDYTLVKNTEGQVYQVQQIDQNLLLGHHRGAFSISENSAQHVSDILGAWTFLELKRNPNYVIGGTYKGLLLFKKEVGGTGLKFVRQIKGFEESSRVMDQDDKGNIWMSHGYKGVYRLRLNEELDSVSVKYYGEEAGFPTKRLINLWRINNRMVFTTERSIYRYNEPTDRFVLDEFFQRYFADDQQISYLDQDPLGNIYYISPDDIGVLEQLSNGTYKKKSRVFNRLRGLLNDDLQNLSVLNANHVLYGAKEGFLLYTKSTDNLREIPYKTLIRRVSITANSKDSVISLGYQTDYVPRLAYKHNSLHITYSAPYYHGSEQTSYQYQLVGLDGSWSEWHNKTDKEYTNLPEGTFVFKVRAKNIYDELSEVASFRFRVLPPWYRSTLAYVAYFILGIFSIGLMLYVVDRSYRKEKRRMALKQKKEIYRMDNELKSSEEQIQQLKNEKLQTEVDRKSKELALSTMHLLNKNSFINSVKLSIGTIMKRSKNQEVKKELTKLMSSIDKNIAGDKDWEHFAIHFDEVHGDFTRRLKESYPKLTPQEMKLSAYLRMNLSTKEIAHLLNISVRGVEIARYRLRKKLNLERSTNLQEFILRY